MFAPRKMPLSTQQKLESNAVEIQEISFTLQPNQPAFQTALVLCYQLSWRSPKVL
jgi:hypothetical protein